MYPSLRLGGIEYHGWAFCPVDAPLPALHAVSCEREQTWVTLRVAQAGSARWMTSTTEVEDLAGLSFANRTNVSAIVGHDYVAGG